MRKTINVKNLLNTDGALTQEGGKDSQGNGQAPECFGIFKKKLQGWRSYRQYTTTGYLNF